MFCCYFCSCWLSGVSFIMGCSCRLFVAGCRVLSVGCWVSVVNGCSWFLVLRCRLLIVGVVWRSLFPLSVDSSASIIILKICSVAYFIQTSYTGIFSQKENTTIYLREN
jgi:hypothetical protein